MELGARMRNQHFLVVPGPLAVVMPPDKHDQFSRVIGMLAAAKRPMRIFKKMVHARAWLEEPDIRAWRGQIETASKH